jgi:hypothetical protein
LSKAGEMEKPGRTLTWAAGWALARWKCQKRKAGDLMFSMNEDVRIEMYKFLQLTRWHFLGALLLFGPCFAVVDAQTPSKALPGNYKTIFENPDVLVMHVHYAAREFVPMHDHSAYPTVYVYLNDSGEVAIVHEAPDDFRVVRPPTHTGAFRISPSMAERHSVTNLSDTASDFLRVELKTIPLSDLQNVFRSNAPSSLSPGTNTEFQDVALKIDRIVCPQDTQCTAAPATAHSLLIALTPQDLRTTSGKQSLRLGDVVWLSAEDNKTLHLSPGAQSLRIALLYPE